MGAMDAISEWDWEDAYRWLWNAHCIGLDLLG